MIQEYLQAVHARVEIYKKWDQELSSFLQDKNFRKYEEAVAEATISLRAIREAIKDTDYPPDIKSQIDDIEDLEDRHLRANVEFHKNKIQNREEGKREVLKIESEIMESIQELLPNNEELEKAY